MSLPETIQHIYQELAERYARQKDARLRDIFLLLAADVAFGSGKADEAEKLHRRMVQANPNSLLRPYPHFAAALSSLDIQDYLADLRRQFPPETAERLLLQVRANPLGKPANIKSLSQRDTQEINPVTSRTINMPPPSKRKSPYENSDSPSPLPDRERSWNLIASDVWLLLLGLVGLIWMIFALARPFWQSA